jgi:hypothetical protein
MNECEAFRLSVTELEVMRRCRTVPPELAAHRERCADCRRYLSETERLMEQLRSTPELPLPPGLLEQLQGIPERQRLLRSARMGVFLPAAGAMAGGALLALGEPGLILSTMLTLAGAFVAVTALLRTRLLPD